MPKHNAKIGLVSLKLEKDGRWRARWWNSETKKYRRFRLPATNYKEAVASAKHINEHLAANKGFIPGTSRKSSRGVSESVMEMIQNADASPLTKKDYVQKGNQFLAWLREKKPGVTAWAQVNPKTFQDYLRHCENLGLAHDSVRMRFHVVRATSLYMSKTYPDQFPHVAGNVRLKRAKPKDASREQRPLLSAKGLLDLLDFASETRPDIYPIMLLQGLAGLRIYEAVYLREQDIDFGEGTITITVSSRHTPKTRHSNRTIPVPGEVMIALENAIKRLSVRHPEGFIFLTDRGEPWSVYGIAHALGRIIKACWRETKAEAYRGFWARRLRAVFVNVVRQRRADYRVLQSYLGHAAGDVLGEHYEQSTAEQLRGEIVDRIEAAMDEARHVDNPPKTEERKADDLHKTCTVQTAL